jgi:hypothetical protein
MNYVNTNSNIDNNENILIKPKEEKKWSELSEEEKSFHVHNFLDSYKLYNKTKLIEGVKDSVASSVINTAKYILFLLVSLVILTIVADIFGGVTAVIVFIFGLIALRMVDGVNSIKSLVAKKEPKKNKGDMFLDYLSENSIIYDTDISPMMVLELYKEEE